MRSHFSAVIFFGFRNELNSLLLRFREYVPSKNHMASLITIYRKRDRTKRRIYDYR